MKAVSLYFIISATLFHNLSLTNITDTLYTALSYDIRTPVGIRQFIKEDFNKIEYRRIFLPNNFYHFEQLLDHGTKTAKNKAYMQAVLRLLNNGLKSSSYINARTFQEFLPHLNTAVSPLCSSAQTLADRVNNLKQKIYSVMVSSFTRFLSIFKQEQKPFLPFLDSLSEEIAQLCTQDSADVQDVTLEDFQKTALVFLETSIAKLIWSPEDGIETWNTTKQIGQSLVDFYNTHLVADQDDLNGLCVSLVERYAFFLELMGTHLQLPVLEQISNEISGHTLTFLQIEEQEEGLITKQEILMQAILQAQAQKKLEQISTHA